MVGVDVVVAGLLAHPTENNSRVVKREDVLVPVLCLVLRSLPLLPAVQVLALLLLQTLELLPETGLASPEAARTGFLLQFCHPDVDLASVDPGRVVRQPQVDHRPRRLDHRILLVVVDQLGEGVELLPAADVVLVPCAPDHHVGHLVFAANREDVVTRVALGLAD